MHLVTDSADDTRPFVAAKTGGGGSGNSVTRVTQEGRLQIIRASGKWPVIQVHVETGKLEGQKQKKMCVCVFVFFLKFCSQHRDRNRVFCEGLAILSRYICVFILLALSHATRAVCFCLHHIMTCCWRRAVHEHCSQS